LKAADAQRELDKNRLLEMAYRTAAEASYRLKDYTTADAEIKRALEIRRAIPKRNIFDERDASDALMLAAMIAARQERYPEAQQIIGGPIAAPRQAPLGPTCIYKPLGAKAFVTVVGDVDEITTVAKRAAALTHQLLIFSRREVVQPEVLDLNAVVGEMEGLLRRTMYNLAVDTWRQRRRRPEVFVGVEPPGVPDPADTVALRQALVSSLAQLAPRQRAVLVLRYWEQLSEAEAAQVLGCSVGNIKSTASRGLARLREATAGWAIKDTPVSRGVHR